MTPVECYEVRSSIIDKVLQELTHSQRSTRTSCITIARPDDLEIIRKNTTIYSKYIIYGIRLLETATQS